MPQPRQPYVHDLATVFDAPTQVLSRRDGEIAAPADAPSAQGVIHADVRVLGRAMVTIDGLAGEHLATEMLAAEAVFTSVLPHVGVEFGATNDPQFRLDRLRTVEPGLVTETLTLSSVLPADVDVLVAVEFATDAAPVEAIRAGAPMTPQPFDAEPVGDELSWSVEDIMATILAPGAELAMSSDGCLLSASWLATVAAAGKVSVTWQLAITDLGGAVIAPTTPGVSLPTLAAATTAGDHRLRPWLERSIDDLNSLRLATTEAPGDAFFAAGVPWYLTLFGRDSIWAARMLLPLGHRAWPRGTLRALARRQGTQSTTPTPRRSPARSCTSCAGDARTTGRDLRCRRVYYGTIDATPLWICLLHDAWRAGLPEPTSSALLPHLEARARLAGRLRRRRRRRLPGVHRRHAGGPGQPGLEGLRRRRPLRRRPARPPGPIALCEVQGYAHEAALGGAALLDAFGRPGGDRWRRWAARLADRFRSAFWVRGRAAARIPALALDGDKRPVDSLDQQHRSPARHRAARRRRGGRWWSPAGWPRPSLDSGFGLRTMSATRRRLLPARATTAARSGRTTPAIVIAGLDRAGLGEYARPAWSRGCCGPPSPSTGGCPSCGAARAARPYPTAAAPSLGRRGRGGGQRLGALA